MHTYKLEIVVSSFSEHNYDDCTSSDFALAHIAGYVSRKSGRYINYTGENNKQITCENCMAALIFDSNTPTPECYELINMKTKGFLANSSVQLFNLINVLEKATLTALKKNKINADTVFDATAEIEKLSPPPFVGYKEHCQESTNRIMIFYVTMRMHFIVKQSNKNDNIERHQTKEKRKFAKLVKESKSQIVIQKKGNFQVQIF